MTTVEPRSPVTFPKIMAVIVAGRLDKQIGVQLRISQITVKAHRGKMTHKMGAFSLADLVRMAERFRTA